MHCTWIPGYTDQAEIDLTEAEAHHLLHVLRGKPGMQILFTNGNGITGTAEVIRADKKKCTVHILDKKQHTRSAPAIHIAAGLLHNTDRQQFMLEKLTELGVARITPLLTANAERRHFNREKAEAHMIAALKQSAQPFLPVLDEMVQFLHYKAQTDVAEQRFIAHCRHQDMTHLAKQYQPADAVCIAIGPEGDFTREEVEAAEAAGFRPVSLGRDVLRAETAAVTAAVIIKTLHAT